MTNTRKFDADEALESMMQVFWRQGYEATSFADLVAASGVLRQSLYNAFGNKEAIFDAALERYGIKVSQPILQTLSHDDPETALAQYFEAIAAANTDHGSPQGCLIAGSESELGQRGDALSSKVADLAAGEREYLEMVFSNWIADGKLAPQAKANTLAATTQVLARGIASIARSSTKDEEIRVAAKGALQSLCCWILTARKK